MEIVLRASSPFSLSAVVHSHGWVQLAPFKHEVDGAFSYVTRLEPGRVLAYETLPVEGGLRLRTKGMLEEAEQTELAQQVRWMVNLDQDLAPFYEVAGEHPRLAHVVENRRGRLLRSPTLFEDVVKTILTTNTSWAGTKRMVANVVTQFGDLAADGDGAQAFPTAERLAATSVDSLRQETGLGYRAPYVLELSQAVASGTLALEELKHSELATPALRSALLKIKGVGNYAAANLLLLLGRTDFIPIDSWALRMVSQEWHDGKTIGPDDVEAAFAEWGKWKGLVYWFWEWSQS